MIPTLNVYDHTVKKLANKEITFSTLKLMLLSADAVFDAAHTTLTEVNNAGAYQVSGNGWAAGGELLDNVAVSITGTNDAKLTADNISVTATGGPIGPASAAVLYDDTGDVPLLFIEFTSPVTRNEGDPFIFTWHPNGITSWVYN